MFEVRDGERVKLNSFWTIPTGTLSSCDVTFVNQTDQANCGCLVCQPPFVSSLLSFPYRFLLPLSLSLSPPIVENFTEEERIRVCCPVFVVVASTTFVHTLELVSPWSPVAGHRSNFRLILRSTKLHEGETLPPGRKRTTFSPSFLLSLSLSLPFLEQEFDLVWRSVRSSLGSTRIDFIVFSPRKKKCTCESRLFSFLGERGKRLFPPSLLPSTNCQIEFERKRERKEEI